MPFGLFKSKKGTPAAPDDSAGARHQDPNATDDSVAHEGDHATDDQATGVTRSKSAGVSIVDVDAGKRAEWQDYVLWAAAPIVKVALRSAASTPPPSSAPTATGAASDTLPPVAEREDTDGLDVMVKGHAEKGKTKDTEELHRRVVQSATYEQRRAMMCLVARAMGSAARGEIAAVAAMLLPPPYQLPPLVVAAFPDTTSDSTTDGATRAAAAAAAAEENTASEGAGPEEPVSDDSSPAPTRDELLGYVRALRRTDVVPPLPPQPKKEKRGDGDDPASPDAATDSATRPLSLDEGYKLIREAAAIIPTSLAIQLGIGYAATHRAAARRLAELLDVDFHAVVGAHERSLCAAMIAAANAGGGDEDRAAAEGASDRNKLTKKLKKGFTIGAFVVVGGALCVVTGGIAAAALGPALAGLAGAVGAGAAATSAGIASMLGSGALATMLISAVAVIGQAAIVVLLIAPVIGTGTLTTVFGATGATLAGYRASSRVGDVEHFRLRYVLSPEEQGDTSPSGVEESAPAVAFGDAEQNADDAKHHTGVNWLVSTVTRQHQTVSGALVPVERLRVAQANLCSGIEQSAVLTVGVLNRVGEYLTLAALRARGTTIPERPPIQVRIVARYVPLGQCRFAPVPVVNPGAASVSVFHNRPKFPTGAECVLVLRPLLCKSADTPASADVLDAANSITREDDIWIYSSVSFGGAFTAAILAFPCADSSGPAPVDADDDDAGEDDEAPSPSAGDAKSVSTDDEEAALLASETAERERQEKQLSATINANIAKLRSAATGKTSHYRNRQVIFSLTPGKITECTVKLVADETAEHEVYACDPGYRKPDEALVEAADILATKAAKSARRKAAVVVRFGADDESDGDNDDESDARESVNGSMAKQPSLVLDSFADPANVLPAFRDTSFVVEEIGIDRGEFLPLPPLPPSSGGAAVSDLEHSRCPMNRAPRELPRRHAFATGFRNEQTTFVPAVRGASQYMRLRHRRLTDEAGESGKGSLIIVAHVTLTGNLEYAVVYDRAGLPTADLVANAELKPAPAGNSERAIAQAKPHYDNKDAAAAQFSVTAQLDPDSGAVYFVIADEESRRRRAARRRMSVTVAVAGYSMFFDPSVTMAQQQVALWRESLQALPLARGSERYVLEWEPELLHSFGDRINHSVLDAISEEGFKQGQEAAVKAAVASVAAVFAAVTAPCMALGALQLIDNSFAVLQNRSISAGQELAAALVSDAVGRRPLSLVGFSFGGAVALECAKHLVRIGKAHAVEHLVLLGATSSVSAKTWRELRACIPGRVINIYTKRDLLLSTMLRLNSVETAGNLIAGLNPVDVPGVENVDASAVVEDHMQYATRLQQVLALIPSAPSLAVLRPRGHNPGHVVPLRDAPDAVLATSKEVAPGGLTAALARGTRGAIASLAPSCTTALFVPAEDDSCIDDAASRKLLGEVTRLELCDERVFSGDGCWAYAPPHSIKPGSVAIFALRGSASGAPLADDREAAAVPPRLAAYAVYRFAGTDHGSDLGTVAILMAEVSLVPAHRAVEGDGNSTDGHDATCSAQCDYDVATVVVPLVLPPGASTRWLAALSSEDFEQLLSATRETAVQPTATVRTGSDALSLLHSGADAGGASDSDIFAVRVGPSSPCSTAGA